MEKMEMNRPELSATMKSEEFLNYYYLKEELIQFSKSEKLQTSGSKQELTERIAAYLKTGQRISNAVVRMKPCLNPVLTLDSRIEANFVCSEQHRVFFRNEIGDSFKFCVAFQRWLKANMGRTYQEAIAAYYEIMEEKKKSISSIDRQFEYNTYIRDFFANNKGKSLQDAIACWKYKKSLPGHNRYEAIDLSIL